MKTSTPYLNQISQDASQAIRAVLKHEGFYSFDPDDPGGETKYGISKRAYPKLDIKSLTQDDAARIYYNDYWQKLSCAEMYPGLSYTVFDCAVNQGTGFAAKALQRCIGENPDGIIGPSSLATLRQVKDSFDLLVYFHKRRALRYAAIVRSRPRKAKYIVGWLTRLFDVQIKARHAMNVTILEDEQCWL